MHTQALTERTARADAREQEQAIRLANIAGVEAPEQRVSPDMPATIRYGDPNLAALYEKEARIEVVEEALTKLETLEISGDAPMTSVWEIDGIAEDVADRLAEADYDSPDDLRNASDEDLLAIDGISPALLKKIRKQV